MSRLPWNSFSSRIELYKAMPTLTCIKWIIIETSVLSFEALRTKLVEVWTAQQLRTAYPFRRIKHEDLLEDVEQLFILAVEYLNANRSTLAIDSLHIFGKMNLLLLLYSIDFKSSWVILPVYFDISIIMLESEYSSKGILCLSI